MNANGSVVRLEIPSSFDMLDFVQLVCDRMGQMAGIDEDNLHWIGVAVREAVISLWMMLRPTEPETLSAA